MAPASDVTETPLTHTSSSTTSGNGNTIDSTHPYFLHASDAPGMILVNTPFDGRGYAGWSRSILISLSAKNKLGFIDGSCPMTSSTDPTHPTWSRCNHMVTSWLLNSLTKVIADSVLYSKTAKDLWLDLEHRFGQPNESKLYHLQKELADLVQGTADIATYFTRMKRRWDELDTLNSDMQCSCNCDCGGKKKMQQFKEDERLIQFLMGLNETYGLAWSNILMVKPLPSVNQAYSLLMQDENQREIHVSSQFPTDGVSFMVKNQGPQSYQNPAPSHFPQQKNGNTPYKGNLAHKGKKNTQMCSYCKMTNHTIDNCYRLVGFPADFKFTKNKRVQNPPKGNSATVVEDTGEIRSNMAEGPQFSQKLSSDQFSQLVNLLNQLQTGQGASQEVNANSASGILFTNSPSCYSVSNSNLSNSWTIDSGATEHMCFNANTFLFLVPLPFPLMVKLPNSSRVKVTHAGSVSIFPSLVLKNGPLMKSPQVFGEAKEGLYLLEPSVTEPRTLSSKTVTSFSNSVSANRLLPATFSNSVSASFPFPILAKIESDVKLWHVRSGHLPFNAMKYISSISFVSDSVCHCDVCPLARQSRLPFSLSHIKTKQPFE
ncbi:PREDICTED: uncharacterized protein LOC109234705 [Nicotiana attenuata]|uniref:uncharacterized protein LOC109234705 n=1 Tax=Nicotiana attenuata TaxID=49451 RepID=UPI00090566C7|nr:PREDICTED: uncharacterized protein LOC109234705 [Nicotiana attenuata]